MNISSRIYDSWTRMVSGSIGLFSPSRAMSYAYGREGLRSYIAATRKGPNKKWRPRNQSADAELKKDFKFIMARCRDLARNNPYIKGIIRKICDNVVRKGIKPQARIKTPAGKLNKKLNTQLESLWTRWTNKKYADVSGHDSIYALQKLVLQHVWTDGEVFLHRVWSKDLLKKGVVPFQVETLECDLLDDTVDGTMKNGNIARRGIEFDPKTGRPVAYHFLSEHPGDYQAHVGNSKAIPAADILHLFKKERASQTRGVSWFSAIVMEAFDLQDYQSFERLGAKLAAAFCIFVKSQHPDIGAAQLGLGGQRPSEHSENKIPDYIEPARIQTLPQGTEIQLASHKRPGETYSPYVNTSLKGISAGTGTSYSSLSNDYSDSSYSADRSSKLEERISYQSQQDFLCEKMNGDLWNWFLEGVFLAGLADLPGYKKNPDKYEMAVEWQKPGWTWVDPMKDSKAAKNDLDMEVTTRHKIASQKGDDWDEIVEERIREEEALLELAKIRQKRINLENENKEEK